MVNQLARAYEGTIGVYGGPLYLWDPKGSLRICRICDGRATHAPICVVGQFEDTLKKCADQTRVAEQHPKTEANARLIAAAPDLLSAAREVIAAAEEGGWHVYRGTDEPRAGFDALRAAIAKAEGR